jgi:hypothetical protein
LHRRSVYYAGLSDAGKVHLMLGGDIGPDGMPMSVGMNSHDCCTNCDSGQGWPCETVRLLLEAGVISELATDA